jgi:hypothetical protein
MYAGSVFFVFILLGIFCLFIITSYFLPMSSSECLPAFKMMHHSKHGVFFKAFYP